ncbi:hypothetical protein HanRHA438_Chr13g0621211 [Helianthus annuus]|nr:hypothetical protein HanRHA438_Chr13g0621111 [Helianthus annuus]KAJ0860210.1 hypothetical protein HanRHA438_Chr13g0621211 [Helianthus annuus]
MLEIIEPSFHRCTGYLFLRSISKHSLDLGQGSVPFLDLSINSSVASNAFHSCRGQLLKEDREQGRENEFSH